jgi:ribosomal-protein-alanine N-acetyltransferase
MTGPGPDLVIREAVSADLGPVVQIERRSFADAWSVEALFGELQADAMRLPLVAEVQGEVAGYLMAWLVADQLHVLNIATDPDRLRRGVGTALLLEAARRARQRGAVEVTLEVRRSNYAALAFYRQHAFAQTGVRPRYYQDNGEDAIIMTALCADLTGE